MTLHESERHEEALNELLASEGDGRAAFEATSLAACAECRAVLSEHVALEERLEALGRAERTDVRRALELPALQAGRAEAVLLRHMRAPPAGSRSRRAGWTWIAAGLAAALALVLWLRSRGGEPGPLLGVGPELVHPLDEVESFAPFRWNDEGPLTGWYRVVVFPDGKDVKPTDSGPLREKSWSPDPAVMQTWGERIHWRLEVYGGAGEGDLVDAVDAWAELSSR